MKEWKKKSGLNGIRAHEFCDIGPLPYQVSYQASWELVIPLANSWMINHIFITVFLVLNMRRTALITNDDLLFYQMLPEKYSLPCWRLPLNLKAHHSF